MTEAPTPELTLTEFHQGKKINSFVDLARIFRDDASGNTFETKTEGAEKTSIVELINIEEFQFRGKDCGRATFRIVQRESEAELIKKDPNYQKGEAVFFVREWEIEDGIIEIREVSAKEMFLLALKRANSEAEDKNKATMQQTKNVFRAMFRGVRELVVKALFNS